MMHLTNEQLIDYMHGALAPEQDAAVYEHIESCAQCRAEYDAELALTYILRAHAASEERELPSTLKAELWSRIRAAEPSTWSRIAAWVRPSVAVPVAAVLALAAYFGNTYLGAQPAPSIEAAYYLQDHAALNGTVPFSDHSVNPVEIQDSAIDNQQSAVQVQPAVYTADASR